MKKAWDDLATEYENFDSILIGDVDCEKEEELCSKYKIVGFPEINAFKGTKKVEYPGNSKRKKEKTKRKEKRKRTEGRKKDRKKKNQNQKDERKQGREKKKSEKGKRVQEKVNKKKDKNKENNKLFINFSKKGARELKHMRSYIDAQLVIPCNIDSKEFCNQKGES